MANNIIISPPAYMDIDEAIAWYETQKHDLGIDFLLRFYEVSNLLTEHPHLGPIVHEHFRRILMGTFPYAIYYAIEGDDILIIAVWNEKRSQKFLKKRLKV